MKDVLLKIITAGSGISSKRVCGILGWLVCLISASYCTIQQIEAPQFLDSIIIASTALLGVDSITSIWKKKE